MNTTEQEIEDRPHASGKAWLWRCGKVVRMRPEFGFNDIAKNEGFRWMGFGENQKLWERKFRSEKAAQAYMRGGGEAPPPPVFDNNGGFTLEELIQ